MMMMIMGLSRPKIRNHGSSRVIAHHRILVLSCVPVSFLPPRMIPSHLFSQSSLLWPPFIQHDELMIKAVESE